MNDRKYTRYEQIQLRKDNKQWPEHLIQIEREKWPVHETGSRPLISVWRSTKFLVMVYRERPGVLWMSVNRTEVRGSRWVDGITWDELQRLKREIGCGDKDAIEIYPRDVDVVNVANIRHLFVFEEALVEFTWRKSDKV